MRSLFLLSASVLCTVALTEHVSADLGLPNVGECRKNATDKQSGDYCDALQECMQNDSDDLASVKGCVLEAQDAYAATSVLYVAEDLRSPLLPDNVPIATEEVNSELVSGIQGEKGWTNQQQGPNN